MPIARTNLGLAFRVERGRWADYLAMAKYHYRAARPATVHSVWRLVAAEMRNAECGTRNGERRPGRKNTLSIPHSAFRIPHLKNSEIRNCSLLWRFGGYPRLAGVLVVSYPVLCAAARNAATGGRYCTWPDRRVGLRRLNREVRTISRVIVHPLYRGLGLATDLVAAALRRLDCPVVESFARMGEFVPFFRSAGMRELRLPGRTAYYFVERRRP